MILANAEIEQQNIEVNLYALKDRINQIYFSILLITDQIKQNTIQTNDLQGILNKAIVALENGTGYKSNVDELKAEMIEIDLATIELATNQRSYLNMLALLVGQSITAANQLVLPKTKQVSTTVNRPEIKRFELQNQLYNLQETQLKTDYKPRLSAFVQTGFGRPTLNIIDNKTGGWYIGGLRLNWCISGLYTLNNNKNLLKINRQLVDADKETFLFNTNIALSQQNELIKKAWP